MMRESTGLFAIHISYLATAIPVAALVSTALAGHIQGANLIIGQHLTIQLSLIVSSLLFVLASVLAFVRPRLGYWTALPGGLLAISCLAWIELSNFYWGNSWIALNTSDAVGVPGARGYQTAAELTILSSAFALVSVALSVLRLLPANWMLRGTPLRELTWPAFGLSAFVTILWFGVSVTPYRRPGVVHLGVSPELRILHITKRGLLFHESSVNIFRDARFTIWHQDRRLAEYRFTSQAAAGVMPTNEWLRSIALAEGLSEHASTPLPTVLRAWDAEGWYVLASGSLLTFTSKYQSLPPRDVIELFNDVERLDVIAQPQQTNRDVCLGLCYGPLAALGFDTENHQCTIKDGTVRCP
jgi:hypothetical protein